MTDGLTVLYEKCEVHRYFEEVRHLVADAIRELYRFNPELVSNLRVEHIDRAIYKYLQASRKRVINNSLQYFKACIMSSLREYDIDRQN